MTGKERSEGIEDDLKKTYGTLILAFWVGWGAVLVHNVMIGFGTPKAPSGTMTSLLTAIGFSSFLWTLAWLAAGFLFGFLFGIPKVVTQAAAVPTPVALAAVPAQPVVAPPVPEEEPDHHRVSGLKVNTNLEEISDWLTKILVGATLTQIMKIPAAIYRCALFMASYDTSAGAPSFNAAILVYYSVLGFLAGYILTRLFFARAFALAAD